ncbi:MAG: universal stress protein [Solirubrobacterales bacterium]|jgi:nucleotide-binding universal stress UspA family protein|nr:universal stress protein [Solirubrobacterales bacterium]MCW3025815.1 universal stress protein [Solirubrobacterales bacterium]
MSCYRDILVAHDGSADADAALQHAIRLARDQHACLTLLTVAPQPHPPAAMSASATPDLLLCFADGLRAAAESVPDDIGLRTQLLRGEPAETILHAAREGHHDLIVMGSHGHGRLHRALLGSVSFRVLHDSRVPVLFIRHGSADATDLEVVESAPAAAPTT